MDPTPDEAFELEQKVLAARMRERSSWMPLAAALYAFHSEQAWKELGWERFTDWLADPELGLGRRHAYRMIAVWSWAQDNAIADDELAKCDVTKLAVVLPPLLRGDVDVRAALDDVQALSRSDLTAKYVPKAESVEGTNVLTEPDHETCQQCGREVRVQPA